MNIKKKASRSSSKHFLKAEEAEKFKKFVLCSDDVEESRDGILTRSSKLFRNMLSDRDSLSQKKEVKAKREKRKEARLRKSRETLGDKKERLTKLNLNKVAGPFFVSGTSVFNPDHPALQIWDVVVALVIVYSVLTLPVQLAFEWDPQDMIFVALNWFIDALFAVDIFVHFNTAFLNESSRSERQNMITDRKEITIRYLAGWFAIDFLSTVPLDRIITAFSTSNEDNGSSVRSLKMIRGIRLVRLVKLARILNIEAIIIYIDELEIISGSCVKIVSLAVFLAQILFVSHLIACVFFSVGNSFLQGSSPPPEMSWLWHSGVSNLSGPQQYIASLYWCITTIMSIGYGDIVATSNNERAVAIATELFGAVCFGLLLMFVSDFAKGDPIIRRRGEKEFVLKSYLRHYNVPRTLSKKIQLYYNSIWDLKSQIDLDALHDSMPMSQCAIFLKTNNKDMFDRTFSFFFLSDASFSSS